MFHHVPFVDFRLYSNIMWTIDLASPRVRPKSLLWQLDWVPGSGHGGRDQRWLPQISSDQFHNRKVSVGSWGCSDHSENAVLPDPCFLIISGSARASCILLHLPQQKSFSFLSRLFWQMGKCTRKKYSSVVRKPSALDLHSCNDQVNLNLRPSYVLKSY